MCAWSESFEPFTKENQGQRRDQQERNCQFTCKRLCCKCAFCYRVATKERRKFQLLSQLYRNKICERCFLFRSLELCKSCHKCPNCCHISTCRGKATPVLEKMGNPGGKSKGSKNTQRGLHPPFLVQTQPNQITNCHKRYVNPHKNPLEALYQLVKKNAVAPAENQNSLGFYNRLFLVPKPNNRWRPILDLITLNTFLNTESFKMETPETIRTSLQTGESVTSIDFKEAYFCIPIHSQSRKYMRFHIQGRSYHFKALPFGLSTAPMEFSVVAKEVKLMALQRGIRIHQYLDDWLVRATSYQTCLQHTQTLVALCRELGWLVNKEKSELDPKQVFNFVGYQLSAASSASASDSSSVTSDQFSALSDKMSEQFARFEALLSRGNIFSAPIMPVNPVLLRKCFQTLPFLTLLLPDPPVRCGFRQELKMIKGLILNMKRKNLISLNTNLTRSLIRSPIDIPADILINPPTGSGISLS